MKLKGILVVVTNIVEFEYVGGGMLLEEGFTFMLCFLLLDNMVNCKGMWLSNTSGRV